MDNRSHGFTLLEVLVAVGLAVLLAGVVLVSLSGPHRQAVRRHAVDRITFVDGQMRARAVRFQHALELVIDLQQALLYVQEAGTNQQQQLRLPLRGGLAVKQALAADRRAEFGRFTLPCSPQGVTPTYALELVDARGRSGWLLFSGITGQPMELEHEREVQQLLSFLAAAGRDPA